ncbi:hypothetical protein EVAR_52126_1 [Eumeta japonica]|uniref:Uncharacterized protein n=1 Tax=Eumeta variegata TaxID=151549 RepID=A0A4C1XQU7_EUMVA|nr:hypothetical protein EVAR_52126_1 [Eumeta japonica]
MIEIWRNAFPSEIDAVRPIAPVSPPARGGGREAFPINVRVPVAGAAYLTGGKPFATSRRLLRYQPAPSPGARGLRGEWSFLADMDCVRYDHAAAVLDGRLYVVGGRDENGTALNTVSRYDFATHFGGERSREPSQSKKVITHENWQSLKSHRCVVPASWVGIKYMTEGGVGGDIMTVGDRNSHSLDETQQRKLLLHTFIFYEGVVSGVGAFSFSSRFDHGLALPRLISKIIRLL